MLTGIVAAILSLSAAPASAQCEFIVYTPGVPWQVEAGTSFPITWCTSGPCYSTVAISLWNDGVYLYDITQSTANDGRYDWSVPGDLSGTAFAIGVQENSGGLVGGGQTDLFEIVQYTPFCRYIVTNPACAEWRSSETYTITWESFGSECGGFVDLDLGCDGIHSADIAQGIPNTGSYQWTIPAQLQCPGAAFVAIEDSAGAVGSSRWFSVIRAVFADGFESGDMHGWSYWTPG